MEKVKLLLQHRSKLLIGVVIVMALSLPLVVNQVLKQQDIRQHASSIPAITLMITPSPLPTNTVVNVGQTLSFQVLLTTDTNDIGALSYTLNYDPTLLQFVSNTQNTDLKVVYKKGSTTTGTYIPTYLNLNIDPSRHVTGYQLPLDTYTFKVLAPGTAKVWISPNPNILATATGYNTYIPVNSTTGDLSANYVISNAINLTPTPASCNNTTGREDTCQCSANSQCFSNNCGTLPGNTSTLCLPPNPCKDGLLSWHLTNSCNNTNSTFNSGQYTCTDGTSGTVTSNTCISSSALFALAIQHCTNSPKVCPSITPTASCVDSDNGLNYNTKGNVSGVTTGGIPYTEADFCYGGNSNPTSNVLIENICKGTQATNVSFLCPNGCSNGACLPPIVPTGKFCLVNNDCPQGYYCPECGTNQPCTTPTFVCQPGSLITPTVTLTTTPTPTPSPTPTMSVDHTRVKLAVSLPGIGNKFTSDNHNPQRSTRTVWAKIENSTNQDVKDTTGTLVYNSANGDFEGTIDLGASFTTGAYSIIVKLDNTLYKRLPGIVTITTGSDQNTAPSDTLIPGDMNGDNVLDINDYTLYIACYQGLSSCTSAQSQLADFNSDGIVKGDINDLTILERGFANRNGD